MITALLVTGVAIAQQPSARAPEGPTEPAVAPEVTAALEKIGSFLRTLKAYTIRADTEEVKLGGDLSVAAGPVGAGAKAATADLLSFSRSKGIYGGISLAGMVIGPKGQLNHAYYGHEVSPLDILVKHQVQNPGASQLVAAVTKMAGIGN